MTTEADSSGQYAIVVHNDDRTPMNFVMNLILEVFGQTSPQAFQLMLRTHVKGSARLLTGSMDVCKSQLVKAQAYIDHGGQSLKLSLEPVELVEPVRLIAPGAEDPQAADARPPSTANRSFLTSVFYYLRLGLQVAFFRRIEIDRRAHPAAVVGIALLSMATIIITSWALNGRISMPSPWGISSEVAAISLMAAGFLFLSGRRDLFDAKSALAIVIASGLWLQVIQAIGLGLWNLRASPAEAASMAAYAWSSLAIAAWFLAFIAVFGARLTQSGRIKGAIGFVAVCLLSSLVLPNSPMVGTQFNTGSSPGLLSYMNDFIERPQQELEDPQPEIDIEAGYARQPALMSAALDGLLPSRKDRSEIYFVAAGTYAEQNVFLSEARRAREIFDARMDTKGRSVLLVNNETTLEDVPFANATNIEAAMSRLAKIIDPEKDVLALFLTSHGGTKRISVSFGEFQFNDLTPEKLSELLAKSGARYRVIILSACYSGSFIPALANDDTLIITAASATKTSFGCSNERDWTYFGDAYFNHALKETHSLTEAFEAARTMIKGWEQRDKLGSSDPQISEGRAIREKLRAIAAGLNVQSAASK